MPSTPLCSCQALAPAGLPHGCLPACGHISLPRLNILLPYLRPPTISNCLQCSSCLLTCTRFPTLAAQDVGRTISDYAAKANADAVVIGSRGLGAFRRRMLVRFSLWGSLITLLHLCRHMCFSLLGAFRRRMLARFALLYLHTSCGATCALACWEARVPLQFGLPCLPTGPALEPATCHHCKVLLLCSPMPGLPHPSHRRAWWALALLNRPACSPMLHPTDTQRSPATPCCSALQGLVGLGSVSDYVAHHAPCTGGLLVPWEACSDRGGAVTFLPTHPLAVLLAADGFTARACMPFACKRVYAFVQAACAGSSHPPCFCLPGCSTLSALVCFGAVFIHRAA
jgi:hypothetical protein